jgi:hypothetical protein
LDILIENILNDGLRGL